MRTTLLRSLVVSFHHTKIYLRKLGNSPCHQRPHYLNFYNFKSEVFLHPSQLCWLQRKFKETQIHNFIAKKAKEERVHIPKEQIKVFSAPVDQFGVFGGLVFFYK